MCLLGSVVPSTWGYLVSFPNAGSHIARVPGKRKNWISSSGFPCEGMENLRTSQIIGRNTCFRMLDCTLLLGRSMVAAGRSIACFVAVVSFASAAGA